MPANNADNPISPPSDTLSQLEAKLESASTPSERLPALLDLAKELRGSDSRRTLVLSREALTLARSLEDPGAEIHALLSCAIAQSILGSLAPALADSYTAFELLEGRDDPFALGLAYNVRGMIERSLGNLDRSLQAGLEALRSIEKIPAAKRTNDENEMLGWVLYHLSGVYFDLKDLPASLEHYRRCLEVFRSFHFPGGEARALDGLGNVAQAMGDLDGALEYYRQALEVGKGLPLALGNSRVLTDIATCFEEKAEWEPALEHHRAALREREKVGFRSAALTNRIGIGRIELESGALECAEQTLLETLTEAKDLDVKPKLAQVHKLLGTLASKREEFQKALEHFVEHQRIREEVFSEESTVRLKNLQVAHQAESSRQEAEIHRLKNVELVRLNGEIQEEKEKSDVLIRNILPERIIEDLQREGRTEPEVFENVTVFFSDFVGFTTRTADLEPSRLIAELNEIFTALDERAEAHGCERIKTIGDAYLAVCGLPCPDPDHASNILAFSRDVIEYLEKRNRTSELEWPIRIGVHTGRVVGGVVGVKKYIYDVFGDTINTASRYESHSEPMQVNVSEETIRCADDRFTFEEREPVEMKGKGTMRMWFLGE